jgi:hypothetical protein
MEGICVSVFKQKFIRIWGKVTVDAHEKIPQRFESEGRSPVRWDYISLHFPRFSESDCHARITNNHFIRCLDELEWKTEPIESLLGKYLAGWITINS